MHLLVYNPAVTMMVSSIAITKMAEIITSAATVKNECYLIKCHTM